MQEPAASLRLRVHVGRVGPLYGLVVRSRRGRRTGRRHSGFLRNLGRPALSAAPGPEGETGYELPACQLRVLDWRERSSDARRGTATRTERSVPDGARESERLIVPAKPANTPRVEPVEGRRCRVMESLEGN